MPADARREPVTEMSAGDAKWAAALMERRRHEYFRYSPVFWRPAEGVTGLHEQFLRRQIAAGTTLALRTGHGFIICERRRSQWLVDDFAVEPPGEWDSDGAALLLAAAARLAAAEKVAIVRVVTAQADRPKAALLGNLSLTLAEQWWVRELQPAGPAPVPGRFSEPGFSGLLGPAPPVYDPGGLVFLSDRADEHTDFDAIERAAAAHGAVLAVLPATPDAARARRLRSKGWTVASDWYQGTPTRPKRPQWSKLRITL